MSIEHLMLKDDPVGKRKQNDVSKFLLGMPNSKRRVIVLNGNESYKILEKIYKQIDPKQICSIDLTELANNILHILRTYDDSRKDPKKILELSNMIANNSRLMNNIFKNIYKKTVCLATYNSTLKINNDAMIRCFESILKKTNLILITNFAKL